MEGPMKKLLVLLALACVVSLPASALADMFTPSPSCSKPYKPFEFSSRFEYDSFMDDVRRYKQCISDFAEEQQEAARRHTEAAEEAIDEWNSYVRRELN